MYQKIMVPLDGSELAECVLPHVEAITKGCGVPNIVFVYVVEPLEVPLTNIEYKERIESEAKLAAKNYLEELVSLLKYDGVNIVSEVIIGKVTESLIDYAISNEVDLIIIATHGRGGISRWVRGSVADRILQSSSAPVLMIRAPRDIAGP